jgi:hypothetical protein
MATRDNAEVLTFLEELEMGDWDGEPLDCETDKAWDAMHRCLSDGTLVGSGRSPLDLASSGGGSPTRASKSITGRAAALQRRRTTAADVQQARSALGSRPVTR